MATNDGDADITEQSYVDFNISTKILHSVLIVAKSCRPYLNR